jgi:hypothetical protein
VGFELIGEALTCGAIWNEASEQHFSPTPFREKKKKEKKTRIVTITVISFLSSNPNQKTQKQSIRLAFGRRKCRYSTRY